MMAVGLILGSLLALLVGGFIIGITSENSDDFLIKLIGLFFLIVAVAAGIAT